MLTGHNYKFSFLIFSFYTKRKVSVCADPKQDWVKKIVRHLRYGSPKDKQSVLNNGIKGVGSGPVGGLQSRDIRLEKKEFELDHANTDFILHLYVTTIVVFVIILT